MIPSPLRSALFGAVLALASPIGWLPLESAQATSFAPMTTEQLVDASDFVIRGTVEQVWTELDEREHVWTRARITVAHALKGADAPAEVIVDSLGGSYGAYETTLPGHAVFSAGEEVVAFLSRTDSGRLVPVAKFLGKYTVRRAPGEHTSYVMRWQPSDHPVAPYDARFIPHARPEDRVALDDLLAAIETRVQAGWDGKPIPGIATQRLIELNAAERRIPR